MRIKFSARAWMLSIATGLVFLPTMDAEAQSGSRTVQQAVVTQTPEAEETEQQSLVKRQLSAIYGRFGRSKKSPIQQTAGEQLQNEPRRLSAEPGTRAAIKESKPASRRLFPSLFPRKKAAPVVQPADAAASNAAANERLRKMYERDGRPVPSYLLDSSNTPAEQPKRFQRVQPAQSANLPRPQAARLQTATPSNPASEIRQVSNNPFKRFFSKLNPLRRSSKPKPKSEKPDHVEPLPQFAKEAQQRLERNYIPPAPILPTAISPAPISPASNPAIERIVKPVIDVANDGNFIPQLPAFDSPKAPALLQDEGSLDLNDLPDFKPAAAVNETVIDLKDLGNVAIEEVENSIPTLKEDLVDTPVGKPLDSLENPFPELSEDKAGVSEKEENPFTGLTLDANNGSGSISAEAPTLPELPDLPTTPTEPAQLPDLPAEPMPAKESTPLVEQPALPELPSFSDDEPAFGESELPAFSDNKLPEIKADKLPEITLPEQPVVQQPSVEKKPDHSDKLQKIADRKELQGLKGFCPVDLRDNRGLTDAVPEFNAEFEGVTYNFSSLEAQQKFVKSPAKYAPAAGGNDIVKTEGDVTVGGSLDHAVWYKDRLYLFSSQVSMQTFVIEPAKYGVAK